MHDDERLGMTLIEEVCLFEYFITISATHVNMTLKVLVLANTLTEAAFTTESAVKTQCGASSYEQE